MDKAINSTGRVSAPEAQTMNERVGRIAFPETWAYPGDLMDNAIDKLRTIHLALSPDNTSWHDEASLMSIWTTLDSAIRDLEPVRNRLQGTDYAAA